MISFARGVPAPECLPVEELADCARAALERDGRTILSYGPSPGYAPLREWIAARHGVDRRRVFITNGSLQGFVFLAQRLAPGKRVLVEQPDLRPAAEDPARARRRRRRARTATTRGSTRTRSSRRFATARRPRSCT